MQLFTKTRMTVIIGILLLVVIAGVIGYQYWRSGHVSALQQLSAEQNVEYSSCLQDWQNKQTGSVRPATFYGSSECMGKLAIKYNNVSMCEIIVDEDGAEFARFFCMSNFALAKNDLKICTDHLTDRIDLAQCITNIALQRNDSSLCTSATSYFVDKTAQTYFNDVCYNQFAVQQGNATFCEKIVNRTGQNISALCQSSQ